ncbi:hypothetical protein HK098_000777 [Nowakowskiella sp. JEL0407]|nr:hypothetical protein HK098_000777 [Nowakowskiella sp. JEL0407]
MLNTKIAPMKHSSYPDNKTVEMINDQEEQDRFEEETGKAMVEKGNGSIEFDVDDEERSSYGSEEDGNSEDSENRINKKQIRNQIKTLENNLDSDIKEVEAAVELFLNSKILESEALLKSKNLKSLYHTHALSVLTTIKSVLTFEPPDVKAALESLRSSIDISSALRKEQSFVSSIVTGVFSTVTGSQSSSLKGLSRLQKHAELIYAEANLLKAMLCLIIDTNIVAFVQQGLNIRNSYNVLRNMYKCMEKFHEESGIEGFEKEGLDATLIQGVLLNMGCFGLTLSLLPSKSLRILELVGFSGDRNFALICLQVAGGWGMDATDIQQLETRSRRVSETVKSKTGHAMLKDIAKSGKVSHLRKFLCDLYLLVYHVVLCTNLQLPDINLNLATQILNQQLEKHPNSFVFLEFAGRLNQTQANPVAAIKDYERVVSLCCDLRNLSHTSYWDIGICQAALLDWDGVYKSYGILFEESKWTKAVYRYIMAVALHAKGSSQDEVCALLEEVPKYMKKVAGKSVPIEKFVVRKCRKYAMQKSRLLLPIFEIFYFLHVYEYMTQEKLREAIELFDKSFEGLNRQLDSFVEDENFFPYPTFYDDMCSVKFLKGVALYNLALPATQYSLLDIKIQAKLINRLKDSNAICDAEELSSLDFNNVKHTLMKAVEELTYVISHADKIKLDHWMLPFAKYERGQIYMRLGELEKAKQDFETASNGYLEEDFGTVKWVLGGRKKPSMGNMLQISLHNASAKIEYLQKIMEI